MNQLYAFLVAVQFLTRLPIAIPNPPDNTQIGRSLPYYPLAGLLLGLMLAILLLLLDDAEMLRAALVLTAWVALTGALHLDGLADSADAWTGGLGDRARTLAIMKDPCCGPSAVVTIVLVLLIKFAALQNLASGDWLLLALVPALARGAIPLLFLTTPYVRPGGLGTALAENLPRTSAMAAVLLTWVSVLIAGGVTGLWMTVAFVGMFALLRGTMMGRLGGTTGDTAGATIEIIETTTLIVIALM